MREIKSTKNKVCFVDDDDFERISAYSWHDCRGYAVRTTYCKGEKRSTVFMHREIIGAPKGSTVDHINGNILDNRKSNLRLVTKSQNAANRKKPNCMCTSIFKGVQKKHRRWLAQIVFQGTLYRLGTFEFPELAAIAYDEKAIELLGEYARTNLSEQERLNVKIKYKRYVEEKNHVSKTNTCNYSR